VPKLQVETTITDDGVYRFSIPVRAEGKASKGGLRIVIPAQIARGLRHMGWGGKHLHVRLVDSDATWIAWTRPHPKSVTVALPKRLRGDVQAGDSVEVEIFDPSLQRCTSDDVLSRESCIDWAAAIPHDQYFAIEESNGTLAIHSRHEEPFLMKRYSPLGSTAWLLGFYLADGNKTTVDWTVCNKNPLILEEVARCLELMGIERSRAYLEVIHGREQPDKEAVATFAPTGIRVSTVRVQRSKKGGNEAAIMHLPRPLLRMTLAILGQALEGDLIDRMARHGCKQFALGFLDGDGTVTIHSTTVALRLSGPDGHQLTGERALLRGFSWEPKGARPKSASDGLCRTLRVGEGVALLLSGGFRFSLSRARLFFAIERNLGALPMLARRKGAAPFAHEEALAITGRPKLLQRWGLLCYRGGRVTLTPGALNTCRGWEQLTSEYDALLACKKRWVPLLGKKGHAYPLRQSEVIAEKGNRDST
jgi:hypothetical protein